VSGYFPTFRKKGALQERPYRPSNSGLGVSPSAAPRACADDLCRGAYTRSYNRFLFRWSVESSSQEPGDIRFVACASDGWNTDAHILPASAPHTCGHPLLIILPGIHSAYLPASAPQEPPTPSDYAAVSTAPSFRFRLERVRAVRERKEDLARQELARAVAQLSGSQDRLRTVEDHLAQAHADQRLAAIESPTAGAAELLARQAFVEHIEAQRTMGMRELERHEADVAAHDAQLGQAAREHQMLERLKERHRVEHQREAGRRESGLLDEIALDRFRRSAA